MAVFAETARDSGDPQVRPAGRVRRRLLLFGVLGILLAGAGFWFAHQMERTRLRVQLVRAVQNNDTSSVRRLLKQGADPDVRLDFRRESFSWKRVWTMLRGGHAVEPIQARTVLMEAAYYRQEPILRLLLEYGADVGETDFQGQEWTAMDYAATGGDTGCVEALIAHGADVNRRGLMGVTPLIRANFGDARWTRREGESCAGLLVRHGAQVNARMDDGETPLMYAITRGSDENARLLLARGAEVNAADITGQTALMRAAINLRAERMRLLLKAGASVNAKDNDGRSALAYALVNLYRRANFTPAERKDFLQVLRLLLENGATREAWEEPDSLARQAAEQKHDSEVMALFQMAPPAPNKGQPGL